MSQSLETMVSNGVQRDMVRMNTDAAKQYMNTVEQVFGKQNWAGYVSIGNPVFNPVMNTNIVTAVCGVVPQYLWDSGARVAERKFHLDTGFMYDKAFTFAPSASELPSLPQSAKPIAIGYNLRIAGRGGDPAVEDVWDCYFSADPDEAEPFFGLEQNRGSYATYYGVTYQHQSKEIVRVKVYTYDSKVRHGEWEQALEIALALDTNQD